MATKQPIKNLKVNNDASSQIKGSGDKTVTVSGDPNTGRHAKQSTMVIKMDAAAAGTGKTVTINQNGAGILLSDNNAEPYSISLDATNRSITIQGQTNAKQIRVAALSIKSDGVTVVEDTGGSTKLIGYVKVSNKYYATYNSETPPAATLTNTISINGESAKGSPINAVGAGAYLDSDPGSDRLCTFSYSLTVPKNTVELDCNYMLRIYAYGDDVDGKTLTPKYIDVTIVSGKAAMFLYVKESESAPDEKFIYTLGANNSVSFFVDSNTSWTITK